MSLALLLEQVLNGIQLGVMLFLMAAGLTLIFGILNFISLVHGSLYMLGAFFAASVYGWTNDFVVSAVLAVLGTFAVGIVLDVVAFRRLYMRSHLDQVLGTFGLLLFFNDLTLLIWGAEPHFIAMPQFLSGSVPLVAGSRYPIYRLAITGAGLAVAAALYVLIMRVRLGMLIRAAASNRQMLGGLGINVRRLILLVFGLSAAMAGFAGVMTGPLVAVQVGMGDAILITAFVVVVIGGIGSVRGAFLSALLVGLVDTMGRALLPHWLGYSAGPAVASMSIYLLMAVVLLLRPAGLFAAGRA
ncbi:MAG TPA: branched-chain amino acid ABC transporter permease [Stellaceae bacterium]|nr:branched-chain amino acid ABC transporter permease [Stellaceae bacterium]